MFALLILAASGGWFVDAVESGGYPALTGLLLVENLFPPIPSEAILPVAGYFIDRGTLSFVPALIAATIGSVVGAVILYAIGRYGGRPLLDRYGKYLRLDQKALDRGEAWFNRYGPWVVLFGRLVPGVRSVVSVPAGWAEMGMGKFLLLTTIGSVVWNSALIGAGMALGANWDRVEGVISPISRYVVVIVAVAIIVGFVYYWRRRGRRTQGA